MFSDIRPPSQEENRSRGRKKTPRRLGAVNSGKPSGRIHHKKDPVYGAPHNLLEPIERPLSSEGLTHGPGARDQGFKLVPSPLRPASSLGLAPPRWGAAVESGLSTFAVNLPSTPLVPGQPRLHPQVHPHRLRTKQHTLSHAVRLRPSAQTQASEKKLLYSLSQQLIRSIMSREESTVTGEYLARHLMPTLTPALTELMRAVEQNQRAKETQPECRSLNPINWLGQFLFRNNPRFGGQCSAAREYGGVVTTVLHQEDERAHGVAEGRRWNKQSAEEHTDFFSQFATGVGGPKGREAATVGPKSIPKALTALKQAYGVSHALVPEIESMLAVLDVSGSGTMAVPTLVSVVDRLLADKNSLSLSRSMNTVVGADGCLSVSAGHDETEKRIREEREQWLHDQCVELMSAALQEQDYDVENLFRLFDINRDGSVSALEIQLALEHLAQLLHIQPDSIRAQSLALFRAMDTDHSGSVSLPEFNRWVRRWLARSGRSRLKQFSLNQSLSTTLSDADRSFFRARTADLYASAASSSLGVSLFEDAACEAEIILREAEEESAQAQRAWLEGEEQRAVVSLQLRSTLRSLHRGLTAAAAAAGGRGGQAHSAARAKAQQANAGALQELQQLLGGEEAAEAVMAAVDAQAAEGETAAAARERQQLEHQSLSLVQSALEKGGEKASAALRAAFQARERAEQCVAEVEAIRAARGSGDGDGDGDGGDLGAAQRLLSAAREAASTAAAASAAVAHSTSLAWMSAKSREKDAEGGCQAALASKRLQAAQQRWATLQHALPAAVAATHLGLGLVGSKNSSNTVYCADDPDGETGPGESVVDAADAALGGAEDALAYAEAVRGYMHATSRAMFTQQPFPEYPSPPRALAFLAAESEAARGSGSGAAGGGSGTAGAARCVQAFSDYLAASRAAADAALLAKSSVARVAALVQVLGAAREAEDTGRLDSLLDTVAQAALVGLGASSAYVFLRSGPKHMRCVCAKSRLPDPNVGDAAARALARAAIAKAKGGGGSGRHAMLEKRIANEEGVTLPGFADGKLVVHVKDVAENGAVHYFLPAGRGSSGSYIARPLLDSAHGTVIGYVAADTMLPQGVSRAQTAASASTPRSAASASSSTAGGDGRSRSRSRSRSGTGGGEGAISSRPTTANMFAGGASGDFSTSGRRFFAAMIALLGGVLDPTAKKPGKSKRRAVKAKLAAQARPSSRLSAGSSSRPASRASAASGSSSRPGSRASAASGSASRAGTPKSSAGGGGGSGKGKGKGKGKSKVSSRKKVKAKPKRKVTLSKRANALPTVEDSPVPSVAAVERRQRVVLLAASATRVLQSQMQSAPVERGGEAAAAAAEMDLGDDAVSVSRCSMFFGLFTRDDEFRFVTGTGRYEPLVRSNTRVGATDAARLFRVARVNPLASATARTGELPLPLVALAELDDADFPGPCVAWALRSSDGVAVGMMGVDTGDELSPTHSASIASVRTALATAVPEEWARPLGGAITPACAAETSYGAEARCRLHFARLLMRSAYKRLRKQIPDAVSELRRFGRPPVAVRDTAEAVLLLLGCHPEAVADWGGVRSLLKEGILEQRCSSCDPTADSIALGRRTASRGAQLTSVVRRLHSSELLQRSSAAIVALYEWLTVAVEMYTGGAAVARSVEGGSGGSSRRRGSSSASRRRPRSGRSAGGR